MADSLLIFSIGGVQQFIAEARRAQDLWAGSTWLSDATRAALVKCLENARHIFPADPHQPSLPNRFVVCVASADVRPVAEAASQAARQAFRAPCARAQAELRRKAPADDLWDSLWQRQVENHLEIYWAAAPLGEAGYQAAYQAADRAFEAAKRTRQFQQVSEEGLKDSLSGSRSALRTAGGDAQAYWAAVSRQVHPAILKAAGRERLDALGAAKRFGFDTQHFPSVSTVAAASFLLAAASRCPDLLQEHAANVGRLGAFECQPIEVRMPRLAGVTWPYDGDWLYEETFTPARLLEEYGLSPTGEEIAAAKRSLKDLVEKVGARPSRYYAILQTDGNAMGKHVWACDSETLHAELSRRLASFATEATELLQEQHAGRVVYAGGDDLLALVALEDAVPAGCELGRRFAQLFEDWPASALPRDAAGGLPFSLRGGVAFAHHRYPLSTALAAARDAEGAARSAGREGGLAVRAQIRSGVPLVACAPWSGLREAFDEVQGLLAGHKLSPRFAHTLADEAPALQSTVVPPEAFLAELRRVARRQRIPAQLSEAEADGFATRLGAWQQAAGLAPTELATWLLLASFVARGGVQ
ncbi:MAG: type III-B CRISPR-associated protein Cas10/Cmr2 [Anaerolineae bacterium]|nr:type III-B CRISPR-associated protein Cas10/Cmr2 [Anaerolineae bacterium]